MTQAPSLVPSTGILLRTLGRAGLYRGEAVLLAPGKPLALLAYLHALPGRTAARDHLLHVFWADLAESQARHALRQTTYYLRERLGADVLIAHAGSVALGTPLACDRELFIAAVEDRRHEDAVGLYAGEFLPDFALPGGLGFEHWADAERQRLRLLFLRAVETLAREHLRACRFRDARQLAVRAREADPLDESGWRLAIEASLALGDRVSALADGQRLSELLATEGRTPEPATAAVLRRAREEREDEAPAPDGTLVAELVGREAEFARLVGAADRAIRQGMQVAAVVAPAGLGKTRLLRDLSRRLAASGWTAVYARTHPAERDLPWSYAASLIRQLAGQRGAAGVSPGTAATLVALEPSLSTRFAAMSVVPAADDTLRRVSAITELIEAVADERPLALLLDDLHWADAASRDAIQNALARTPEAHCLAVLSHRPGSVTLRLEPAQAVTLEPLDEPQCAAFMASLGALPSGPWADGLPARLHAATAGSPLMLLETLQDAIETGCLVLAADGWSCPDPGSLRTLLEAGSALVRRIERLARTESWLMLLLSLAGTALPQAVLAAASGHEEARTLERLAALERLGMVARAGDLWVAAHDEIAARTADLASTDERVAAHSALGRALAIHAADAPAMRSAAHHLGFTAKGGDLTAVAVRWVESARAAADSRPAPLLLADLLATDPADTRVRALLSTLPWGVRLQHGRSFAALAIAAAAVLFAAFAASPGLRAGRTDVRVGIWQRESPGQGWRLHTHELTNRDVDGGRLALTTFERTDLISWDRPAGVVRPGAPNTIVTTRSFQDAGGEDVALRTADGTVARLTTQRGDDTHGSWSPDGRYLVISTDRWSNESRSDLAIIDPDHPDSLVRRLTNSPSARDVEPFWSPDGTRIAFNRVHYAARPRSAELCVVTVSAVHEECFTVPGYTPTGLIGWASPLELVATFVDQLEITRILVLSVSTGATRVIAEGEPAAGQTHVQGWISCFCRRTATEPYQTLVLDVARPERAVRLEPGDPPLTIVLTASRRPRDYLSRVRIANVDRPVTLDAAWQLALEGWDAADNPVEPLAVEWRSNDTTVATVNGSGEVRPRHAGLVTVRATAGGWRSDSVTIRIGPAEARSTFLEPWRDGLGERWVEFGEPRPFVEAGARPALAPNGDSTNVSGVFLRQLLPTREGIGVEFETSAPITLLHWQFLFIDLLAADMIDIGSWDLERGVLNLTQSEWYTCGMAYPFSGGHGGADFLSLISGLRRRVRVPRGTADGEWVRLRLQFFPDGRCGVAVNGIAGAILDRRAPLGDSALLLIRSYSHRTRIRVGPLEVWQGVKPDIDWGSAEHTRR